MYKFTNYNISKKLKDDCIHNFVNVFIQQTFWKLRTSVKDTMIGCWSHEETTRSCYHSLPVSTQQHCDLKPDPSLDKAHNFNEHVLWPQEICADYTNCFTKWKTVLLILLGWQTKHIKWMKMRFLSLTTNMNRGGQRNKKVFVFSFILNIFSKCL